MLAKWTLKMPWGFLLTGGRSHPPGPIVLGPKPKEKVDWGRTLKG